MLNSKWIVHLGRFQQLILGFSGGLDSTVLLHALTQCSTLGKQLIAVHVNHGISSKAQDWQDHCAQVCLESGVPFVAHKVIFNQEANLEEEARRARYGVFSSLLKEGGCLILAHHQDDQAETLLLQLCRGAGVDGLAAMSETGFFGSGSIARPLLTLSRQQLEDYARIHGLKWIEDESNQEITYSRNFLRHQVMPLLKERWPKVVTNLARTAGHCQQAKSQLEALALQDSPELSLVKTSLSIEPLKSLARDRIVNVLRVWLRKNQVQLPSTAIFQALVQELIFAASDALPQICWGKVAVRRYQQHLYLDAKKPAVLPSHIEWEHFPKTLILESCSLHLIAEQKSPGLRIPPGVKISIRFRQGGETFFWHGQNKSLKKLFQEWNIPPWLRKAVPLLYLDEKLAAVVGYAVSDAFFSEGGGEVWQICNHLPGLAKR